MKERTITLIINGERLGLCVPANQTLLDLLRETLGLTGSKEGCGLGVCGSCTVLMNDQPVRSCLTLAVEADNTTITTIEGLAKGGEPSLLQQAFIDHGAVQCGFCTPGMIMASEGLLRSSNAPDETDIRKALGGQICRCTGYTKIVEAVASVAGIPEGPQAGQGEPDE